LPGPFREKKMFHAKNEGGPKAQGKEGMTDRPAARKKAGLWG